MKLADIGTKNVSEPDLTPRMKYIVVRLENWDRTLVQEGWHNTRIFYRTRVLYQVSSLTMRYFILGVRSGSLTLSVPISANYRPPSHQSILCILYFSPFVKKCILLEMCLVCLVSLPFLAMHIEDLVSKAIKGDYSGTMSGSLFSKSWINTLKCAKVIPEVHATFYSLSALDQENGPGTCVLCSIGPPS